MVQNLAIYVKTLEYVHHPKPLHFFAIKVHHHDTHGAVASLASVAKLPFNDAQDGISNTFSIIPNALGKGSDVYFHGSELDLDYIDFSDMNLDIQIENKIDCACEANPSAAEGAEDRK